MMKTRILLTMLSLMVLIMPACLPTDDVDPDNPVEKFLGVWKVNETCSRMNYDVEILQDPGNSAQILIYNFGNPGSGYDPAVGLVVSNTIIIQPQNIGEGWSVSGNGTYKTDGTVSWDYSLTILSVEYSCTAKYFK
jgi:hypothetical protein